MTTTLEQSKPPVSDVLYRMAYAGGANPNVVVVPATAPGVYTNYASKTSIILGVFQILFAIAFVVLIVVLFTVLIDGGLTISVMGGGNFYYVGDAFVSWHSPAVIPSACL